MTFGCSFKSADYCNISIQVEYEIERTEYMTCIESFNSILKEIKNTTALDLGNVSAEQFKEAIEHIASLLAVNTIQAILLACILESSFTRTGTTVKQICTLLKCSNIEFLKYSNDLDDLIRRRMIKQNITMGAFSESNGYEVSPDVIDAIKKDEPFVEEQTTGLTPEEFFDRIGKLFIEGDNRLRTDELKSSIENLVKKNAHLSFCKALSEFDFANRDSLEYLLFMAMCSNYVNQGLDSFPKDNLLSFISATRSLRSAYTAIKNGRMMIQQKGLVEYGNDNGMADTDAFFLSDLAKEKFFTDFEIELDVRRTCPDLISYDSFAKRELFYNDQVLEQIRRLSDILEENHFKEIQQRLDAASMRKGFNCLFFGAPGTGKTETVYQLARESGRDVLQIDISKLRSKWVGESEKTVRSVFRYYQWLVNHSKRVPILLFNEADGIFGIRAKMAERSADKMNNTIQNIILQEMEKMEGIMIATTNLTENLDSAFERRFLYKVEFSIPEASARSRIWTSMMPFLTREDVSTLAQQYPLSGGQIENISRKCAVEFILEGKNPSRDEVMKMCEQESIGEKKMPKIGF